ncbi:FKBP-type peptidyl-prolyl cis-trans isomerase [Litoribacillus peritrichatus]
MNFLVVVILVALVVFFTKRFSDGKKNALENVKTGNAFLEKNKQEEGVVTTESGLQYQVLTKGTGTEKPAATDKVKVHYHGTLLDGSVFDSSVERGQPIEFFLTQVIPGWTEGLQHMAVGDKTRLFIPSKLGYGNRNVGGIPGGSVLIFDVELLDIN